MAVVPGQAIAQEEQELLSLLGREETTEYAAASFKTNRVINLVGAAMKKRTMALSSTSCYDRAPD